MLCTYAWHLQKSENISQFLLLEKEEQSSPVTGMGVSKSTSFPCHQVVVPHRCKQQGCRGSQVGVSHRITKNHRMLGVGRDLCGSSSPTPLPKQGHLQQAAQDLVHMDLEYLQRRRLRNLPGQSVPVLHHPQREEVLPHVQTELPVPQFVPVAPCPVTGHH